ncbi:MAG: RimK family protein [Planctomycetes bacterium]|nr:RimK family protein [Planctomycetota bacterium]
MQILLVVDDPKRWTLELPGVHVISGRRYLTEGVERGDRFTRVFNLCRSYAYQSIGYYVSLLAEARGHRPQPDIGTLRDMKLGPVRRVLTDELDDLVRSTLRTVKTSPFEMSIYFGMTTAKRDRRLGRRLFGLFRAPLLRAHFVRRGDKWVWQGVRPIPMSEVPESHWPVVLRGATEYFARAEWTARRKSAPRYSLAILHDPSEAEPPSDERALRRFVQAATRHSIAAELITRQDFGRLPAFDALFIRATTAVEHYTYRFARTAEAEGLAVIDDSVSIVRCTNKVYLAECLVQKGIPAPPTVIVHRDNRERVPDLLGFPVVLKRPDSSFSQGVVKAESVEEYEHHVSDMLTRSELVVAQAFTPTDYDWRVGVLDGKPLYVCKYYMAPKHWQIIQHRETSTRYGKGETLAVEDAPKRVISTAVRACRLFGRGLYGVDLKQVGKKVLVIEVNDNPSIDAGWEDRVLKGALYDAVMESFVQRIETIRKGSAHGS